MKSGKSVLSKKDTPAVRPGIFVACSFSRSRSRIGVRDDSIRALRDDRAGELRDDCIAKNGTDVR